jgi:hypothetical protein
MTTSSPLVGGANRHKAFPARKLYKRWPVFFVPLRAELGETGRGLRASRDPTVVDEGDDENDRA